MVIPQSSIYVNRIKEPLGYDGLMDGAKPAQDHFALDEQA